MSYTIQRTPFFDRKAKRLLKKYRSLTTDLLVLQEILTTSPATGTAIGNGCYKIRLAVKSKGKGKSGGARVISTVLVERETVYLLDIYDKSEQSSISKAELTLLLNALGEVDGEPEDGPTG